MRIYVQPDAYICVGLRIRTRRLVPPYVQTNAYVHKKTLMFLKKLGKFLEKLGKFFKNISTFFMQEQIESPSPIRSFLLFPSSLHSSQNTLFIKRLKMTALPLILVSAVLSKSLHKLPSAIPLCTFYTSFQTTVNESVIEKVQKPEEVLQMKGG